MDLITPDIGLVFWTTLSFLILFFLMSKFAWKPIVKIINDRNIFIEESIEKAKKSHEEFVNIKKQCENLIKDARIQKEDIIKEAEKIKKDIINSSKEEAQRESFKVLEAAKKEIDKQKEELLKDIKQIVISVSLSMSESILKQKLQEGDINSKILDQEIKNIRF